MLLHPHPLPTRDGAPALTVRELARCFDLPVTAESRVLHAFPTVLPSQHPLRYSVPCKILAQSLWLCGILNYTGGGLNYSMDIKDSSVENSLFSPAFGIDSMTNQLVSQEQFNLSTVTIDETAVKMDDASVPVSLWDNRLIQKYPKPHHLRDIDEIKVTNSLNTLRQFCLYI